MRAVAPVVLGPLLPSDPVARAAALDAGMACLDDYLAHFSLSLQRQTRLLFGALALLPVRLLLLGSWRRWRSVEAQHVEEFLLSARNSDVLPLRRFYNFLQSMAVVAWFDLPAAWEEIGYPGPPIERPVPADAPW